METARASIPPAPPRAMLAAESIGLRSWWTLCMAADRGGHLPADSAANVAALRLELLDAFESGREKHGDQGLSFDAFAPGALEAVGRSLRSARLGVSLELLRSALLSAAGADLYLARACEAGIDPAWGRLHASYAPRLRSVAVRRGLDLRAAIEIAEDVISNLATKPASATARCVIGTYNAAGSLFGWLAVILVRRIAGAARKRRPLALDPERDRDVLEDAGRAATRDPMAGVLDAESARELRACLERGWKSLTQREQLALLLKYHTGLKQRRVAQLLGVGEPRVSRLVSQALSKVGAATESWRLRETSGSGSTRWGALRDAAQQVMATWAAGPPSSLLDLRAGDADDGC